MAIFVLIFEAWEMGTTKGATLDFALALLYLALTIACDVLLLDSGIYSSLDETSYYRGAIWSAAIVWTIVSAVRLWFYASKPISNGTQPEPTLPPFYAGRPLEGQSMRDLVKNIFSNPSKSKKPRHFASLLLFVILTVLPTIFSSLMASVVLCDPNVVQEYQNCTVWESTESKRIATGTLLIAQAVIPGALVSIPVCFSFLFVFAVCKDDCCDDDDD